MTLMDSSSLTLFQEGIVALQAATHPVQRLPRLPDDVAYLVKDASHHTANALLPARARRGYDLLDPRVDWEAGR
jgi:hypothetical protein